MNQPCLDSPRHSLDVIAALSIHHSFTFSLETQNLPFQPIFPPYLSFFTHWTAFMITGLDRTYHAREFIFSFFFYIFCLFRVVD